ncbi:hypothetical protein PR048_011368 [Dryococelus australis]|uniref:Uncharacterized protein n=1 Tax=Dryococelus australis TaxID=614101 RepID=A0ABQ9HLS1_9NEOP|nr:hypothetical protein PR048_011368 [Dryococelus australis]
MEDRLVNDSVLPGIEKLECSCGSSLTLKLMASLVKLRIGNQGPSYVRWLNHVVLHMAYEGKGLRRFLGLLRILVGLKLSNFNSMDAYEMNFLQL